MKWIKLKPFLTWGSGFTGESTRVFSVFKIFHNMGQQITDHTLAGYPKFVFYQTECRNVGESVLSYIAGEKLNTYSLSGEGSGIIC